MAHESLSQDGRGIAPLIDHTLLKAEATWMDVLALCREAASYGFATVCVTPCMVRNAAAELRESRVRTCTVVGFPLGASTPESKAFETQNAVMNGAEEIDMVIAVGALKDGDNTYVAQDIRGVVSAAGGCPVKVIIETVLLTQDEKVAACRIAVDSGAAFVKTSTGFAGGGATVEDIRLMRETVGDPIGVKASGGIRTTQEALAMIEAGANRIGTSSGIAIVT